MTPEPPHGRVVNDGPRALTVLLVDDEDEVRETVALLLESDGHTVLQARLGTEAIGQFEAGVRPDIVLTDLCMPQMTGWEVARTVKARWPGIPVGLITGWSDDLVEWPDLAAKMDFVIRKPIDRQALRAHLPPGPQRRRPAPAREPAGARG